MAAVLAVRVPHRSCPEFPALTSSIISGQLSLRLCFPVFLRITGMPVEWVWASDFSPPLALSLGCLFALALSLISLRPRLHPPMQTCHHVYAPPASTPQGQLIARLQWGLQHPQHAPPNSFLEFRCAHANNWLSELHGSSPFQTRAFVFL